MYNKRDGITIIGDKDKKFIALTSLRHHYALVLPYTEDWVFTNGTDSLLRGNAGVINLTLTVEKTVETPQQHLETHRQAIRANPANKGIEKLEMITFKGEPVLTEIQDGAAASGNRTFQGVQVHHFFAAKNWKGALYVLHLSQVVSPKDQKSFDESMLLSMVTRGFSVDFMREEESAKTGKGIN